MRKAGPALLRCSSKEFVDANELKADIRAIHGISVPPKRQCVMPPGRSKHATQPAPDTTGPGDCQVSVPLEHGIQAN